MNSTTALSLIYLIVVGAVNIWLSYAFGNKGVEAFLTATFGLVILFHLQVIVLIRSIDRSRGLAGQITMRILAGLVSATFWLFLALAFLIFVPTYLPILTSSLDLNINWILVLAGTMPYAIARLLQSKRDSVERASVNIIVTTYSLIASITALLVATAANTKDASFPMVFTVNVQIILAFVFSRTEYVQGITRIARLLSDKYFNKDDNFVTYAVWAAIALPLFIPIIFLFSLYRM